MASEAPFAPDKRLHPLSWLFVLIGFLRQFIIPLIAIVIFDARDDGSAWGLLLVVPLVAAALWRQFVFRYGFGPRGLVIRDGLLFRNVRQIEYERIENIDTERNLLHRLMNVAEVRLESSTGGRPEAQIRVLGLDAVQELRQRIFGGEGQTNAGKQQQAETSDETLLRLSTEELLRYGFIDNRGMVVVAAVLGVAYQSGLMRGAGDVLQREAVAAGSSPGMPLVLVGIGLFLTLMLLVRLLSLVWALVALHDFTLSRTGTDLRIHYGLFTRVALTLRLQRIQAAHQTESLMHRFFGRVSVALDLAGDGGHQVEENGSSEKRVRWLAPITSPRHAAELIRIALPMLARNDSPRWQTLAPGAQARIFRKSVILWTAIIVLPAMWWFDYRALGLLIAIGPLCWLYARQYVRHTRFALTRQALLFRRGWLTRRLSVVPRDRVQVVRTIASPFDRRRNMMTVVVDTAGASAVPGIVRIGYLTAEQGRALAEALYSTAREQRVVAAPGPDKEPALQPSR